VEGVRHRRLRTFATQDEAIAARAEVLKPKRTVHTFKELWTAYEARRLVPGVVKARTIVHARYIGRVYLLPLFDSLPLDQVTTDLIDQIRADLLAGREVVPGARIRKRSKATTRNVLVRLGAVLRFGRDKLQWIARNPLDGVDIPSVAPRQGYIPSTEEFAALRNAFLTPHHRLMIETLLLTGLRSGELRGLTWPCVDLKRGRIFVEDAVDPVGLQAGTKSDAGVRELPLSTELARDLRKWRLQSPVRESDLVFPNEEGRAYRADELLRKVLRPALRRAGLPPSLRIHDLRKVYGTMLVEAGVPLKDVQELMGHRHFGTTLKHYAQATRRERASIGDRVASALGFGSVSATVTQRASRETVASAWSTSDAPVAESVDATDLKSVDRKVVPVRVRPGAPSSCSIRVNKAR